MIREKMFPLVLVILLLATKFGFAQGEDGKKPGKDSIPNTQKLEIPMTPPEEALKMMELPEGFKSTLFAAEPDVHQPISITTDARGRLWVAECYTYSDRKENYNTELNDRIVIFEDTDNDGKFDNKKVFWDKGKKLTSIEVGMRGVWVTAAPNLMFIPDADFDDVPDGPAQIVLDGFEGDVIRHNIVNGLRWGPDGWLYGRHGIQATSFVGPPGSTDSQRIAMNCSIWRIHPVTKQFEIVAQGGTNPWGFDYDQHGEMFMINTVIGHLFHVVPNARYRRMYGSHFNPHLYGVIEQTADHFHWDTAEEHWAVTKKEGMSDGTDKAGGGHAHTGLMIYQGLNWPAEFRDKLYTANFHGRRINSDTIEREGNSYVSRHGSDYFKTKDLWFRGVEMVYGPDGGVYLLDWSDIGECHENDGIHRTSGRIFKLTYGDPKPPEHKDLRKLTDAELVELVVHENEWYARKARRLLQERSYVYEKKIRSPDPNAKQFVANTIRITVKLLKRHELVQLKFEKNEIDEQTRVRHKLRLMWTMHAIAGLIPSGSLIQETSDPDEHIRAWAVRLLADGQEEPSEQTFRQFKKLAETDPSGLVRLYVASSLPRFKRKWALAIAEALSQRESDADDRVQPMLIWFGLEPHVVGPLNKRAPKLGDPIGIAIDSKIPLIRRNIIRRLTHEIDKPTSRVATIVDRLIEQTDPEISSDIVQGMQLALDGWSEAPKPANWSKATKHLSKFKNKKIDELVQKLNLVFGDGRTTEDLKKIVADDKADYSVRNKAIVALSKSNEASELFEFFKPHLRNRGLASAVTKAFVRCDNPEIGKVVIGNFGRMDPEGKAIAINTLVARPVWAKNLLSAIANGKIDKSFISASHARQIVNMGDESITKKLSEVWGEVRQTSAERKTEIEKIRTLLKDGGLKPDLENGKKLFVKNCANCHTMFGTGGKIGPDLTGSDRKNLNYLLENIVDPSASLAQSYRASILQLTDGRVMTGVVMNENERTLDLQTKDDLLTLDRKLIDDRKLTDNSLMPDGLLETITEQEIVDLFEFLSK